MARSPKALARFLRESARMQLDPGYEPISLGRTGNLRLAADAERAVRFEYTRKRDGVTGAYIAHPYSRRGNKIYATESKHGHDQIHSFIESRIREVEVRADDPFLPVWPTEPETI